MPPLTTTGDNEALEDDMLYQDAVAAFLTAKRGARRSQATLDWYEIQLRHFQDWLATTNIGDDITTITPFHIDQYLAVSAHHTADESLHARFRALRALCNWLTRRNLLQHNPISGVDEPRRDEKPVDHVTLDEFNRYLASIVGDHWTDYRDRLIGVILFWSGLRVSELCALELGDLHIDKRILIVRSGKGGKARMAPLAPEASPLLANYLYARPPWQGPELWLSSNGFGEASGRTLTRSGVQQILRRRCARAGLRNLHPHLWRHGFGTNMLNAGAEKAWVQSVLGHTDSATTDRYAKWLERGIQREFDEIHQRITEQMLA